MGNDRKIILDLCGGTGAWSEPYLRAGYDVRLITLPGFDVKNYVPPVNVHGILAAPPCTEFSLAKGNQPRDFSKAMTIVEACLKIIWTARLSRTLKWWCLENPRGFLRQFLGKPPHTIRYWWYGADLNKPTDLWGYYTLPTRLYKDPPRLLKTIKNITHRDGGKNQMRSITPTEFAKAFFEANP